MTPERWQRVRAVFEQAVDCAGAARAELVARELADDPLARAEVERLLAAAAGPADYLRPPSEHTLAELVPAGPGLQAGQQVSAYVLEAELGRGGQGAVWRALDPRSGRTVALKLLPATGLPAAVLARFRREAEIASRLDHPGICTVYDFDLAAAQPFVAMRFVPGESLQQRLERARSGAVSIPRDQALDLVEQAARALHAAHAVGVVHRDVKPGNLMLTPEGRVVVLDFGIARELDGDSPALTRTGEVFGTPAYMAPEQVEGRAADARSDVWALGVVLFEALLLRPPFHEPTREALYRAILSHELDREWRHLPADLRVVLGTALAKEPARRYASAGAFAEDLAACRAGRPIAARPVGRWGRLWRWAHREPRAAALAFGLLCALLGAAGLGGYVLAQQGRLSAGTTALAQQRRVELMRDLSSGLVRLGHIEAEVRALLAAEPRASGPRATFAIGLASNGRLDDALALCDAAPADQDQPRTIARARALLLRQAKRGAEADSLEAELGAPRSAQEAYLTSLAAEADGKPDGAGRAREAIRLAVLMLPADGETYLHRLVMCTNTAATRDECLRAAAALEHRFPDSAMAWFYIGLAHSSTMPARAREATRRAIALDAKFPQPYVAEHLFLMQDGAFEAAGATFERGLAGTEALSPERQQLLVVRAQVALKHEQFAAALDAAERALVIYERSITVLLLKAKAQLGLELPEARATLQRVLELAPGHAEATALLGG